MTDLTCDVAIIGAGTAGLAAERSARSAGAKTLLIDEAFAGTTCASVGCMPSKLLIAAAHAAHDAKRAHVFGVETGTVRIDGKAVFDRVRRERDRFVEATKKSIDELPDGIGIEARARFVDAKTLALSDGRTVSAKAIVIATGSTPSIPKPFEQLGDLLLTNETVFELHDLPASVAVIGAGPLGLELAQALARLGVRTEVFDEGKKIGGLHDAAVAAQFREIIEKEVPIRLGVKLQAKIDGNAAVLNWTGSSSGEQRFERVLVATGRPPQFAGLDLDTTGLELDKHGTPV